MPTALPRLLLIGGGGHCRSCIDVIESTRAYEIIGILGLPHEVGQMVWGYRFLGHDDDLPQFVPQCDGALVALGQIKSSQARSKAFQNLQERGVASPSIIADSAVVSRHASIGPGSIVMHGAIINAGAIIGSNAIINSRALVEHDVVIGDHCHVSTGSILNGGVQVGAGTFVGSGTIVHQYITIGANVIVAAGAIVSRNVDSDCVVRLGSGDFKTANALPLKHRR